MYNVILVFVANDIQIYAKKKNNCWLIEFVTMKQIPDISEIFPEMNKYNDLSLIQRIHTKVIQNKNYTLLRSLLPAQ